MLSNEAGRFSKVYPAGPLCIPECSFTKDCTTPTSDPEQFTGKDGGVKALTPEDAGPSFPREVPLSTGL